MKKSAVVLARNYSTALSVIRGLGLAGYEIDLVITVRDKDADQAQIATNSKYVNKAHILTGSKYSEATDQKVVDCLKDYDGKHLLFPIDDYSVMLMDKHREELSAHFRMPYIVGDGLQELSRLMDKTIQSQLARQVGMKVPKEWVLDLTSFQIPEDMIYPCFVKPLQSVLGYKTEMKRCDNQLDLASHLADLVARNRDRSILIQEFLTIDEEISMSGVCVDQEILLPGLVAKSRIGKHETGVTLSGSLVPADSVGQETLEEILNVLRAFHYVGQFDMEVLRCGNDYYFGEVNLRSGGPSFAYTLNGVNLTAYAAQAIEGYTPGQAYDFGQVPELSFHKPFVYEKVAWEDYLNFRISKKELQEILGETEDKLLDWPQDPGPGICFDQIMKKLNLVERGRSLGKKTPVYKGYLLAKSLKSSDLKKPLKKLHQLSPEDILQGKALLPPKNKRVFLLGQDYSSLLAMIHALADSDYQIEVIRIFQTTPGRHHIYQRMIPEGFSKYVSKYHICITNQEDSKLANLLLGLYREDKASLLLPTDDASMSLLDACYDQLAPYFKLPHAQKKAGRMKELMDKELQKNLLKEYGFSSAEPDSKGKSFTLLGLCADQEVVIPNAMAGVVKRGQGAHQDVTLFGKILPTAPVQATIHKLADFLKTLHFTGLFQVELVANKGKASISEIKLYSGPSTYALTACRVNLPKMFADYMLEDGSLDQVPVITEFGKRFLNEKVLLEDQGQGYLSTDYVRKAFQKADIHLIATPDDPEPYEYMKKLYKYSFIMPLLQGVKKATKKK